MNNFKYRYIKTGVLVFYQGIITKDRDIARALQRAVEKFGDD